VLALRSRAEAENVLFSASTCVRAVVSAVAAAKAKRSPGRACKSVVNLALEVHDFYGNRVDALRHSIDLLTDCKHVWLILSKKEWRFERNIKK
jgi:hypothetical protein